MNTSRIAEENDANKSDHGGVDSDPLDPGDSMYEDNSVSNPAEFNLDTSRGRQVNDLSGAK